MSNTNTGKQGGAPTLPNNWTAQAPKDESAPNGLAKTPVDGEKRGKDGTQK